MRRTIVVLALVIFGCSTIQQQKATVAKADDLHFHNLQVFPQNIERDELIRNMRLFSRSLGVRCDHCHVQIAETPKPEFDFPNDAKPEKKIARTMIRMTRTINSDFISKVGAKNTQQVTCNTCHRGHEAPEVPPINLDQH